MLNLIHAEIYKLRKSTSIKICFLLSMASAIALICISHNIAVGNLSTDISGSASGLTEIVIVSLLGSLMGGILVGSDFETKTIHASIAGGHGRIAVVTSKVLVYIMIVALLLLPYAITTIVAVCTGADFATPFVASTFIGILSDEAGAAVTSGTLCKIIAVSLVTMMVDAARLSVCIPIAFKIRKPVAVTTIGFAFSALIDLLLRVLRKIPLISDIIAITPFHKNFLILTMDTSAGTLWKAVICSTVFIIVIIALTFSIFRKAEIK